MNRTKYKREKRKQHRKGFAKHCQELAQKARDIGLILHWSRRRGEERRISTRFSIWNPNEFNNPIIKNLLIEEVDNYISRMSELKAFL